MLPTATVDDKIVSEWALSTTNSVANVRRLCLLWGCIGLIVQSEMELLDQIRRQSQCSISDENRKSESAPYPH